MRTLVVLVFAVMKTAGSPLLGGDLAFPGWGVEGPEMRESATPRSPNSPRLAI